jgi:hypothetical protein
MKVVLTGWKPGLKKISLYGVFVKTLNVSIVVAKQHADDLIAGKVVELEIDSGSASDFVGELQGLGVICHTEPEAPD